MSYILDALRKAEHERGNVKKTGKAPSPPPERKSKTDHLLLIIFATSALVLCAAVITIALLVLYRPSEQDAIRLIQPNTPNSDSAVVHNDTNAYANTPLLAQLPSSFRNRLPKLIINAHIHAATNSGASFTILSGERLHNGETSNTGVTVVFIERASLVLRYQDQLFRLPVEY